MKSHLTPVADVLEGLLQKEQGPFGDQFIRYKVKQQWANVVGELIASHTEPDYFENGTLFIWVDSSVWMQDLIFNVRSINEKINKVVGRRWAKSIRFTLTKRN